MESFVARQPIFNRDNKVIAYELLYRDGLKNIYNSEIDGYEATSKVLTSSFGVIGIEELTQGHKAFVNFTKQLLVDKVATVFSPKTLVVEILEDIEPSEEVIKSCQEIKNKGYTLALDDFVFDPAYLPLMEIADIIKVDFMISSAAEREKLVRIAQQMDIELLAEKVETREELEEAKNMGYSYFQGYFFSKPVILKGDDLPVYPSNYFQVLEELNKVEPNVAKISKWIECDMSLSYKLLRLINSALFSLPQEINSIKQAIVLLGLEEVKKWFNLIIVRELSNEDDTEVIKISLIRAKFAEQLAHNLGLKENKNKFFLMGLFSMIDVLMNRKLKDLLDELPIAKVIKDGLLGVEGECKLVYDLIIDYERGNWEQVQAFLEQEDIAKKQISDSYVQAVEWSNDIISNHIMD